MPALRANPVRQANAARLCSAQRSAPSRILARSLSLSRSRPVALPAPAQPGMFASRLAAGGLLLLSLLALSLDGKPAPQQRPPRPQIPPIQNRPGHHIPPLKQDWRKPLQPEMPSPMEPHELSAGGTTALREELSPRAEAASGPAAAAAGGGGGGGGSKAAVALSKTPKAKAAAAAASRLMRDLRPDGKQALQIWNRMEDHDHDHHHHHHHHHHHNPSGSVGGGGGGGGGARRLKAKKGAAKGCFGLKLDRIGSMSGLGC